MRVHHCLTSSLNSLRQLEPQRLYAPAIRGRIGRVPTPGRQELVQRRQATGPGRRRSATSHANHFE